MANLPSFAEDVTASVSIRTYGDLQARLRAMQYTEPVGVDSAPLVKRLLGDVIHVSERNDKLEKDLEKAQREAIELSQIILPLRKENAKLTRENNSLHLEIIHQEESMSERERQCELQLEQLKDEISRLQFVSTQKAQALSQKDQEMTKLHAQLERLVATGGAGSGSGRQQAGMEMRGTRLSQSLSGAHQANTSFLDKSAVQDAAIVSELQKQLKELTQELTNAQHARDALIEKLQHREQEIERLSKLTVDRSFSRGSSGVALPLDEETSELQIEQLRAQVDLLNSQVAKYESRLKSANEQLRRSTSLEQKLQHAERVNEQIQQELNAFQSKYLVLQEENVRLGHLSNTKNDNQRKTSSPPAAPKDAGDETEGETVATLTEQIETLTAQNARLEDALRATHYDKVSSTNALSNANSHNRVLSTDLERSEKIAHEASANYSKTQQMLADANARLDVQSREIDVLRESLQQAEQTRGMESEKNAALHRELRAMDKVLHERDDECRTLHHELSIQKRELDRVTTRLETLKRSMETNDQDDAQDGHATTVANKKALYAQEMKWLEDERRELRQSKEELVTKVLQLEEELQATKMELQSTRLEREDLAGKLVVATKSEQNAQQLVVSKREELQSMQRELVQWKQRAQRSEDEYAQAQVLVQRGDQIENEKIRIQNELLEVRRRLEELRDENATVKSSRDNSEQQNKRLQAQLQQLQEHIAVAEKTENATEKEQLELKRSYESATVELRNVRQLCQHYQSEYEKLTNELQTNQQSLTTEQSALQNSQVHMSDLRTQLRQLQSELTLKQSTLHHTETRLEQEKLNHKTAQSQLMLAQDDVLQLKEANRSMEIQLKQLRDDLKTKDKTLTEKTEAVENFKLLMEQMETSRDQIMFKLKQEQQHVQRQQIDNDDLHARLRDAEQQARAAQGEIASLKKLTRTLDAEKDHVHDQLDLLTEKFHELSEQNEKLQRDASDGDSSVRTSQERMAQMVEQLQAAQRTSQDLQQRNHELDHELENVRHAKAMSDAELRALAQDLENMTIENQALSEECTRLQYATQRGDQSSSSLKHKIREVEKERDILHIELEDLQHTYRALIQETEGTQKALAQTGALGDELTTANETLRSQLTALTNEIDVLRQKNATLATESAAYREQISFLTDKLRSTDELLREADHKYDKLRLEFDAQKQVAQEISAQRYGAQAQNAAVSQRIVHLEAKASNAQFEIKSLQDKLQAESSQRRSLEDLVVSLRQQIAAKDAKIEHLDEQREAMAQEIRSTHQRLVAADAMDMSELSQSPPSRAPRAPNDSVSPKNGTSPTGSAEEEQDDEERKPSSDRRRATREASPSSVASSSMSSILPMRALEMAQRKCQELEDRLAHQDDTIKQLERSRSKFKRFAAKYEREIETRDRTIEELKSSRASSSAYPSPMSMGDAASTMHRSSQFIRSAASSSSSSSSSSSRGGGSGGGSTAEHSRRTEPSQRRSSTHRDD